jgi:ABC-2 type transport system permease protein
VASHSYSPLWQLVLTRIRLFLREPAAVFWTYGFPLIMAMALGIAFRDNPAEQITVDLIPLPLGDAGTAPKAGSRRPGEGASSEGPIEQALSADKRFVVHRSSEQAWRKRLQSGKTDLVIEPTPGQNTPYKLWDEPHRAESRLARYAVEAALLRASGSQADEPPVEHLANPGSRYIDFLLPGLIGMNLMGGGLWGVGFVVVDMRVRKLLKRFLATPMRRSDFLLAIMFSRLAFTLIDIVILLVFGYLAFGVQCQGSYAAFFAAVLLGGFGFAGIGLLVASRAETIETVSGLMNLVMLPMWILSGVFFSSERFPEVVQPAINLLPLTALNQMLRGIMLEGQSLAALWPQMAILTAYGAITFVIALRIFRWR